MSDSDWLDVSSSKESDDNDSVSSRASDHDEVDYGPPSRRSSMSLGSSREGDIEAWEGFAEDSADEVVVHDDLIGLSFPPTLPPALRNTAVQLDDTLDSPTDVVADQRVETALNQSTTGTLSASHTSSAGGHASTAQNSIRDLKLSFPDPLTSSRDELKSPYEDASPSETTSESDIVPPSAACAVDPGPSATPEVLHVMVARDRLLPADLEIVLYGVPVAARWSIIDSILEKAAVGAGLTLTPSPQTSEQYSRLSRIGGEREAIVSFPKTISVIDRTSDRFSVYPVGLNLIFSTNSATMTWPEKRGRFQGVRPSLAIIFLPSMSSVSVTHTCYLPILVPSDAIPTSSNDEDRRRRDAENWSEQSIGPDALFAVRQDATSVVGIDEVAGLRASHVHNALRRLMTRVDDARRRRAESWKEAQMARDRETSQFFRTAVTGYDIFSLSVSRNVNLVSSRGLLAIVVILLVRLYVPGFKQVPTPASRTSDIVRGRTLAAANKSSNPVTTDSVAVIPSSLKDFALAVFNPAPLSAPASSAVGPVKQSRPTDSGKTGKKIKESEGGDGKLMTWSERMKSSKGLILPCSSSFEARSKKALSLIAPKNTIMHIEVEEPRTALSLRLVDSLSQIFDVKALSEVVRHDMKELSDALDRLMIVIGEQTAAIVQESKGTSKVLRERLEQRHGKAKVRAQQLKDVGGQLGGQLLSYVGSEVRSRATQAKGKARVVAETLILSEAWTAHRKRVEEHRKKMEANSIERQKRREIRRARRHARKGKNDGKKGTGMFSRA